MNVQQTVRISFAEDIMLKAHRFSRTARGDRRATDPVATDHRLLDERGRCLGNIGETADPPVFGPLEPTVYLDRSRAPSGTPHGPAGSEAHITRTSAHRKEGMQ